MPPRTAHICDQRDAVSAMAAETLPPHVQPAVEAHLTTCESCRALYRHQTIKRFPRFRGYTILTELGRGGFGVVYKALHHGKGRVEALKVLFSKTSLREAYFENEVRLVAQLRHPNIATLYEAHLSTPPMYYTMEYVAGQHLDNYLRHARPSLEERIDIIRTVAGAVGYAHGKGVVHRDLKPQNIIIDDEQQPRIIDFGISRRIELSQEGPDAARSEGALGTFGYMPPEQIAGEPVDARADIYGLGALLFHVITGQPARFVTDHQRLTALLDEWEVSRAADLGGIIARCVRSAPAERYQSCGELVADLDNYLAGRPVRARVDLTPGYQVARYAAVLVRNYPRSMQMAATALVAVVLTGILWGMCAHWVAPPPVSDGVALVAVKPSTIQAFASEAPSVEIPGLEVRNRKSWRLLYGRLMESLAAADAQPRAVVWDYFFPDAQPEYDAGFVRGVKALTAPVVVGVKAIDINGEPELSPAIRDAVHGWGLLHATRPGYLANRIIMPLAVQRGFNDPVPTLAVRAFAAANYADSDARLRLAPSHLELRYARRDVATGQPRWRQQVTRLPLFEVVAAGERGGDLHADDRVVHTRVATDGVDDWSAQAIALEDVLTASAAERRQWFSGRVVLVGQMIPPFDLHALRDGRVVFGVAVQAQALQSLIAEALVQRVSRAGLTWRACLWCALGALLGGLLRAGARWPTRVVATICLALSGLSLAGVAVLVPQVGSAGMLEVVIAAGALLAAGPLSVLVRNLHERQTRLTPGPVWAEALSGASTTVRVPSPSGSGD